MLGRPEGGNRIGRLDAPADEDVTVDAAPERRSPVWVGCLGRTLVVTDGLVACPLEDGTVPVARCLDCHLLSAVADERDLDLDCRVPGDERLIG